MVGGKEQKDQQSQREDTENTYFLGLPVAYCGIQRPIQWLKMWQRRSGRVDVPEQTTLLGTYTGKIQAPKAHRTFLVVCTKKSPLGRQGTFFLCKFSVFLKKLLNKNGGLVDGWDRRKCTQVGGCPGSGWVRAERRGMPFTLPRSALVCLTMLLVCTLILLSCFSPPHPPSTSFFLPKPLSFERPISCILPFFLLELWHIGVCVFLKKIHMKCQTI